MCIRDSRYSDEACPGCGHERHEQRARYCLKCGTWLDETTPDPHLPEEELKAWRRKHGGKGGDEGGEDDAGRGPPAG